jgi:hypothetical protein
MVGLDVQQDFDSSNTIDITTDWQHPSNWILKPVAAKTKEIPVNLLCVPIIM